MLLALLAPFLNGNLRKIYSPCFLFSGFQLRFCHVGLQWFCPYRSFKNRIDNVMHSILVPTSTCNIISLPSLSKFMKNLASVAGLMQLIEFLCIGLSFWTAVHIKRPAASKQTERQRAAATRTDDSRTDKMRTEPCFTGGRSAGLQCTRQGWFS